MDAAVPENQSISPPFNGSSFDNGIIGRSVVKSFSSRLPDLVRVEQRSPSTLFDSTNGLRSSVSPVGLSILTRNIPGNLSSPWLSALPFARLECSTICIAVKNSLDIPCDSFGSSSFDRDVKTTAKSFQATSFCRFGVSISNLGVSTSSTWGASSCKVRSASTDSTSPKKKLSLPPFSLSLVAGLIFLFSLSLVLVPSSLP
mmetsp:Transcript_22235/g.28064  ORF Transcript_22235/g.28064 Transcript_22235/m.28064 type:complete len:201 (-) Transcript_22235:199-801(-)